MLVFVPLLNSGEFFGSRSRLDGSSRVWGSTGEMTPEAFHLDIVFTSLVQSGFLPSKQATVDHNRSRTDPDIVGTELDHLGPVFCSPWN